MLERLFGSRSRVKILILFLLQPEQKFYIREIARKLRLQINSVRRELENLEKFGILKSHFSSGQELPEDSQFNKVKHKKRITKQEKKYYQANPEFILFNEIKALIAQAQILYEKDFINKLNKIGKLRLLILTGFFVNNENSDIDIMIVGNINKTKLKKLINELESQLNKEINFTHLDLAEFKYRKNITDVFLYNILEGKRIVMIDELGVS